MALPIILGVLAATTALSGLLAGAKGIKDTAKAKKEFDNTKQRNENNLTQFEALSNSTSNLLEELGKYEMKIAESFTRFTNAFEKIQNKPQYDDMQQKNDMPAFNFDEIHKTSVAAGAFLGAATGAACGTVFAAAASAGTMAAVMALGTASTGTAIASISGAAATNAALAALGGGAIAAGGGGMALGTVILSASTLGVGVLVGGIALAITGRHLRGKADEAYTAMIKNEREITKVASKLTKISNATKMLTSVLDELSKIYNREVDKLESLVAHELDFDLYTDDEQTIVENNVIIVALLFEIINTPIIKVQEKQSTISLEEDKPLEIDVNDDIVIAKTQDAKNLIANLN
jgi:hypothetical protein